MRPWLPRVAGARRSLAARGALVSWGAHVRQVVASGPSILTIGDRRQLVPGRHCLVMHICHTHHDLIEVYPLVVVQDQPREIVHNSLVFLGCISVAERPVQQRLKIVPLVRAVVLSLPLLPLPPRRHASEYTPPPLRAQQPIEGFLEFFYVSVPPVAVDPWQVALCFVPLAPSLLIVLILVPAVEASYRSGLGA